MSLFHLLPFSFSLSLSLGRDAKIAADQTRPRFRQIYERGIVINLYTYVNEGRERERESPIGLDHPWIDQPVNSVNIFRYVRSNSAAVRVSVVVRIIFAYVARTAASTMEWIAAL